MSAIFKEIATPPTPPANYVVFYAKADGLLYYKADDGVERLAVTPAGAGTGDLLADGSIPLTANWDVGAFKIIALQFESDVATGTAPFIVASTTVVPNLNADKVDGADLIDEDNMASNSAVHVPTQQSVKAYVDSVAVGGVAYQGGYNAATNTPDLDTTPIAVSKGDMYTVTAAGTFFTLAVDVGDVLLAEIDSAAVEADWTVVQANIVYTAAQIKTMYESNADTNAFTDAQEAKLAGIESGATADQTAAEILAALLTVDGTGSLLDADKLDGNEAAAFATAAQGTAADAAKVKTDWLTVTQAVDLDAIEARVNSLDAAVVLRGSWDASAGTFPGGGTAQAGDSYIISVGGTVNGVVFVVGDRIVAILDNASTAVYAANWLKLDYTDAVLSVNGATGAVSVATVAQGATADAALPRAGGNISGNVTVDAAITIDGRDVSVDGTKLDGIEALADVTDATNVNAAGAVMESDYNANSILAATADNTPAVLTVAEQTLVGRITAGVITALTAAQVRTLLNVEDGATNDQTAAEILTLLLTVDGAGSGLDADTLDGQSSAAFATGGGTATGTNTGDQTSLPITAAPGADVTASGTIASMVAAENLVFGDVCYMNSAGKWAKGDADGAATAPALAMAAATIATDATGVFLLFGFARNDAWAWTVGGILYLSGTAGGLTQTAPSGTGKVIQLLGVAIHADRIYFKPSNDWMVLT